MKMKKKPLQMLHVEVYIHFNKKKYLIHRKMTDEELIALGTSLMDGNKNICCTPQTWANAWRVVEAITGKKYKKEYSEKQITL